MASERTPCDLAVSPVDLQGEVIDARQQGLDADPVPKRPRRASRAKASDAHEAAASHSAPSVASSFARLFAADARKPAHSTVAVTKKLNALKGALLVVSDSDEDCSPAEKENRSPNASQNDCVAQMEGDPEDVDSRHLCVGDGDAMVLAERAEPPATPEGALCEAQNDTDNAVETAHDAKSKQQSTTSADIVPDVVAQAKQIPTDLFDEFCFVNNDASAHVAPAVYLSAVRCKEPEAALHRDLRMIAAQRHRDHGMEQSSARIAKQGGNAVTGSQGASSAVKDVPVAATVEARAKSSKSCNASEEDFESMTAEVREGILKKWHALAGPAADRNSLRFQLLIAAILHPKANEGVVKKRMERLRNWAQTEDSFGCDDCLSPDKIVSAGVAKMEEVFEGLHWHREKAKRVVAAATTLQSPSFGGSVPDQRAELLRLPGIGPKLATLLSFVFTASAAAKRTDRDDDPVEVHHVEAIQNGPD